MGKNVRFSSVVKGNAYGHGIEVFVPIAVDAGVDHFSVFSADEAYRVRQIAPQTDIMIMGHVDKEDIGWAIENDIHFYVFDMYRLDAALDQAKRLGKRAHIHLEMETGMNRTGMRWEELSAAAEYIMTNGEFLEFSGLTTHYAGVESVANYLRVKKQYKVFTKAVRGLDQRNIHPGIIHTACSAAAISYPKTRMDMVRIGILQYDFWPSMETRIKWMSKDGVNEDPLKRMISWKSKVMSVKEVQTGEFIGYGTTFLAQRDMKIASVPVGYSHGYSRALSNTGRVLIRGMRTSVIGIVNMNVLMIDVSDLEQVDIGDEVILIGAYGDLEVSVSSFGELNNQLNYELLSRLPEQIPRRVINRKED
jgi:alanine racemase